jgi:hypothetical protein
MGIEALLALFSTVKLPEAGKVVVKQKKQEGRLIWNSNVNGACIRAKHGEIGSVKK